MIIEFKLANITLNIEKIHYVAMIIWSIYGFCDFKPSVFQLYKSSGWYYKKLCTIGYYRNTYRYVYIGYLWTQVH